MEGLVIRQGRTADLDEVLRLWVQMVDYHARLDSRLRMRTDAEGLEGMRAYLESCLESDDSRLFVAEAAEHPGLVGYLLAHIRAISPLAIPPTCGYISDLCVDEPMRRQGVGRELVRVAQDWFRKQGQTQLRLSVAAANAAGQAFWRAIGFQELMLQMTVDLA
ncbi:MAG: GNAT family N-acetyltransferase [Chloroflexia bacterium]